MCLALLCFLKIVFVAGFVARVRTWSCLYVVFSCVVSLFVFGVNVSFFVLCVFVFVVFLLCLFACFVARVWTRLLFVCCF